MYYTSKEVYEFISQQTNDSIVERKTCAISGQPFKFTSMELDFYRRHGLPSPHKHPDIRHAERFKKVPSRELYLRTCGKCGIETLSIYETEKVYCEKCYNKEIYG